MEINVKETVEKAVNKIQQDPGFAENFKKDPVAALKTTLGIDIPDSVMENIVTAIKSKVSLDKAGDLLSSIKKLF